MTTTRIQVLQSLLTAVPADLRSEVEISFRVPQCGPHHQEGGFLESHLALVFAALEAIQRGEFHSSVPESLRAQLQFVANAYATLATLYVLTHDIDKGNCLTMKYGDGRDDETVTWARWEELVSSHHRAVEIHDGNEEALKEMLADNGIIQISYFHKTADGARMHGKIAAERLRARGDIPEIICKAIDTHEVAYQFANKGGVNLPLFRKVFADMSDEELLFALVVNLADEMGSHGADGPDIAPFVLLAETAVAAKKFAEVEARLRTTAKLDGQKLDKALVVLFKATDAFRSESVDEAYARIARECAIPSYSEPFLREILRKMAAAGKFDDTLIDPMVQGLMSDGKMPKDVAAKLGKANAEVSGAIKAAINQG